MNFIALCALPLLVERKQYRDLNNLYRSMYRIAG